MHVLLSLLVCACRAEGELEMEISILPPPHARIGGDISMHVLAFPGDPSRLNLQGSKFSVARTARLPKLSASKNQAVPSTDEKMGNVSTSPESLS